MHITQEESEYEATDISKNCKEEKKHAETSFIDKSMRDVRMSQKIQIFENKISLTQENHFKSKKEMLGEKESNCTKNYNKEDYKRKEKERNLHCQYYTRYKTLNAADKSHFFAKLRNANNQWTTTKDKKCNNLAISLLNCKEMQKTERLADTIEPMLRNNTQLHKNRYECLRSDNYTLTKLTAASNRYRSLPFEKEGYLDDAFQSKTKIFATDKKACWELKSEFSPYNKPTLCSEDIEISRNCNLYEEERQRVIETMSRLYTGESITDISTLDNVKKHKLTQNILNETMCGSVDHVIRDYRKTNDKSYRLENVSKIEWRPKLSTRRITNCDTSIINDFRLRGYDYRNAKFAYYERNDRQFETKSSGHFNIKKPDEETSLATKRLLKSLAALQETEDDLTSVGRRNDMIVNPNDHFVKNSEKTTCSTTDDIVYMKVSDILHPKTTIEHAEIEVKKSNIHGMGVYAKKQIYKDQLIGEYVGEVIGKGISDKRELRYRREGKKDIYMFEMAEDYIIDATNFGSILRFVNHSCDANSYAEVKRFKNDVYRVYFAADRMINIGEEITIDYQMKIDEKDERLQCFCKSINCRQFIDQ